MQGFLPAGRVFILSSLRSLTCSPSWRCSSVVVASLALVFARKSATSLATWPQISVVNCVTGAWRVRPSAPAGAM
ncbi:unnamed protein product [Amoebophrya sp. A25]|nr:unnamed protein product [Amoebophrya sp. A25]CAD7943712.1 unnamed protein product [Amoebophrya sp. A25]CAD7943716.1 unnamed protein product [Amoebophrya sp. A25]|eukprot:GSA25T00004741001.1